MDKFNLKEYLKNNPLLKEDVSSRFIQKYLSEFNAEDFEIEDIESYSDRDKAIFAYLEIGPGIIVKDEVAKSIKDKSGEEIIQYFQDKNYEYMPYSEMRRIFKVAPVQGMIWDESGPRDETWYLYSNHVRKLNKIWRTKYPELNIPKWNRNNFMHMSDITDSLEDFYRGQARQQKGRDLEVSYEEFADAYVDGVKEKVELSETKTLNEEDLPTREEMFDDFRQMAKDLEDKTGAEIDIVDFGNQFRFHVGGDMIGWWDGQHDIVVGRKIPSPQKIEAAYASANEWVSSFPEKYKDYLSWINKGEEEFKQEVDRRRKEFFGENKTLKMDKFNLKEYLKNNPLLKESIESHEAEAKRFLKKFVDELDSKGELEFIPDMSTGYVDVKDNSYNVDELASIFLDMGQEIPKGKHNKTYKGEAGVYYAVA